MKLKVNLAWRSRQPHGASNRLREPKNVEQGMSKEEGYSPRKDAQKHETNRMIDFVLKYVSL